MHWWKRIVSRHCFCGCWSRFWSPGSGKGGGEIEKAKKTRKHGKSWTFENEVLQSGGRHVATVCPRNGPRNGGEGEGPANGLDPNPELLSSSTGLATILAETFVRPERRATGEQSLQKPLLDQRQGWLGRGASRLGLRKGLLGHDACRNRVSAREFLSCSEISVLKGYLRKPIQPWTRLPSSYWF